MTIRAPNPGEPITAAWAKVVVDELNRLEGLLGGGGSGRANSQVLDALALATIAGDPDVFVMSRIIDVRLTGSGVAASGGLAYFPSQVRYHVRGVRRAGIDLDNLAPVYGRPVKGDESRIYPAGVGTVCFIVRSPAAAGAGGVDAQMMLLPDCEVVARKRCDGGGAAALSSLQMEKERQRLGLPRLSPATVAQAAGGAVDAGEGGPA